MMYPRGFDFLIYTTKKWLPLGFQTADQQSMVAVTVTTSTACVLPTAGARGRRQELTSTEARDTDKFL